MIVLYIYFAPTRSLEPSPRSLPKGRPKVRKLQQGGKKYIYKTITQTGNQDDNKEDEAYENGRIL